MGSLFYPWYARFFRNVDVDGRDEQAKYEADYCCPQVTYPLWLPLLCACVRVCVYVCVYVCV